MESPPGRRRTRPRSTGTKPSWTTRQSDTSRRRSSKNGARRMAAVRSSTPRFPLVPPGVVGTFGSFGLGATCASTDSGTVASKRAAGRTIPLHAERFIASLLPRSDAARTRWVSRPAPAAASPVRRARGGDLAVPLPVVDPAASPEEEPPRSRHLQDRAPRPPAHEPLLDHREVGEAVVIHVLHVKPVEPGRPGARRPVPAPRHAEPGASVQTALPSRSRTRNTSRPAAAWAEPSAAMAYDVTRRPVRPSPIGKACTAPSNTVDWT